MSANTSAEALSNFLSFAPGPTPSDGDLIDRLGRVLVSAGGAGLAYADAMAQSNLSRPEFLSALGIATTSGLVETVANGDEQHLRLTPSGRSLY